jgi:hypothetical protein
LYASGSNSLIKGSIGNLLKNLFIRLHSSISFSLSVVFIKNAFADNITKVSPVASSPFNTAGKSSPKRQFIYLAFN